MCRLRCLPVLPALMVLAAPFTAQAAVNKDYPPQPAMYVIRDADSTLHLYGSAHAIEKGVAWRTDTFNYALGHADEIWLESTNTDMSNPAMSNKIKQSGIDTLHSLPERLSKDEYERLDDIADRLGVQLNSFDHYRPWVLAMMLPAIHHSKNIKAGKQDYTPMNPGVEDIVQTMGLGTPIKSIENVERHMLLFSLLSEQDEKAYLLHSLKEMENAASDKEESSKLTEAWRSGDVELMYQMGVEEMKTPTPGLYDAMMTKRNQEMATNIIRELRGSGNDMVIVGAGHLGGPDGVVALLQKAGYTAERVYDSKPPVASTTNRYIDRPQYRHLRAMPERMVMRLRADPAGNPDIVMLNMYLPMAISGCAEISPLQYYIQNGGDAYDIVTKGFTITHHPQQNKETCGPATKTVTVDIPLRLSHMQERGIDKLRLWWQGGIDTYDLHIDEREIVMTPPKRPIYYIVTGNEPVTFKRGAKDTEKAPKL